MEYASGGDLDGALKKGMSTAQIKMAAVQCLMGLDYLHCQAHVIMRDVKQHNFLLNNGIYQLCDFGISKLLNTTNANAATQCDTPMFFAPEMAARVKYSNKVDIFSAGVMLYYMYQRSYPFKRSTVDQIL